jgi:hypothetical protein
MTSMYGTSPDDIQQLMRSARPVEPERLDNPDVRLGDLIGAKA